MSEMSLTSCAKAGAAQGVAILDEWVAVEAAGSLQDALLELRAAVDDLDGRPGDAVKLFLALRPWLRRRSYLAQHRLGRALEERLELEVTVPGVTWTRPLRLKWSRLDRVLGEARRDVFEAGGAEWEEIRIRLVTKR